MPEDDQERYWRELERQRLAGEVSDPEAASLALSHIRRLAEEICAGRADPLRGALGIYTFAWFGGGWNDEEPAEELQTWGAEFIQLHDALERYQDHEDQRRAWETLIRDAAAAGLSGDAFPEWRDDGGGFPTRP